MKDLALDSRVFLDNNLDCALQEIDLLFNTENTELLGYPTYGTNWDAFLWALTPMTGDLKKYILDKIQTDTFFAKNFNINVDIQYLQGNAQSMYYIKISLEDDNGKGETKTYKLQ